MRYQIRKIRGLVISAILFCIPMCVDAAWQVSQPDAAIPSDPFFQAGTPPKNDNMPTAFNSANQSVYSSMPTAYGSAAYPNQYASLGQPAPIYAVSISGSLKENVERIMGRYHWRVIWKAPYDYNFDGRITGSSLPNVVEKLLKPFPLQAVMYMSNRTVTIVPRLKTQDA